MQEPTIQSQTDATFHATEAASVLAPVQSAAGTLPLRISR